jgi:hypothetical protein
MDISISLPLDSDGFIRRECPNCERQFKWHDGPANADAEAAEAPSVYYCPLCGRSAGHNEWWTKEQLVFIEESAMPAAIRSVQDELSAGFRNSKHMKFKPGNDSPSAPTPLVEPNDMQMVASPCHSYEPVKVPQNEDRLHCLICGSAFAT